MRKGVIYLVPVPIGNLRDITLRALDILKSVSLIACEDTRKTAFLLSQYEIPRPRLISFHKFNERSREKALFTHLAKGEDLAVVSDAGSPTISDPAQSLVASAVKEEIKVIALPGATALIPALSSSGFDSSAFQFLGFLPTKAKDRKSVIRTLKSYPHPSIIYESVHRLKATLSELSEALSPRQVCIAREISKLHEECIRGEISQILKREITMKGEFVIVIDAAPIQEIDFPNELAFELLHQHPEHSAKDLAGLIATMCQVPKNKAYNFVLEHRK